MKDTTGRQYMNKKIVSGFAIAAAATLALGAVATAPANAATKTVKLAYMGPLTGGAAYLGQDQIPGAIWAIDQYNRTNPKVKVELVKADSQCDPTVAANVAPGVAADKKVIGVIGTACSGEARIRLRDLQWLLHQLQLLTLQTVSQSQTDSQFSTASLLTTHSRAQL
jgi:hypothetical protein